MAAPTFLFIKGNYAFADQNYKPSLLINKTIASHKKQKGNCLFPFLMTMVKQGIIDGEHIQLWTKVCRQIHSIKQN